MQGINQSDRPVLGIGLMILAVALLAMMDTTGKYLTGNYPVSQILWVRQGIFLTLVILQTRRTGLVAGFRSAQPRMQILRSLVLVAEMWVFLFAFKLLPLVTVYSIAAATPLIATALAVPLLAERVGLNRWMALIIGFGGVLLIIRPGLNAMGPTMYIPLLGTTLWALYQILVRRVMADGAVTTSLYTAAVGFVCFGLVAPFEWKMPDTTGWLLLAAVGLLGSGAHIALIRALQLAPASLLQPLNYLLVVWGAVFGFLIFGNLPDLWTVIGALIIIGSGLYALHRQYRQRKRTAS